MLNDHIILLGLRIDLQLSQQTTPPKQFQKKESPFKVTDLWAEVQKLPIAFRPY
jgi:hypothetical protein